MKWKNLSVQEYYLNIIEKPPHQIYEEMLSI